MNASAPPLISCQRFLDAKLVRRKASSFKVFVVRTLDIELRGARYRILLDGHHNLAAALLAGEEPRWKGPPAKFDRFMKRTAPDEFAAFLINNLTDSDWYYHSTGDVVVELLSREQTP
jgi:hypothetical protein